MKSLVKRAFKLKAEPARDCAFAGYAFRFNEVAQFWWEERMDPDIKIRVAPDACLLRSHNPDKILGKVGVNLEFEADDKGLFFRALWMPATELGRETQTLVKAGLLDGVSAGFYDIKSKFKDKILVYSEILIREISICSFPVYQSGRIEQKAELIFEKKKPYKKFEKEKPPELI